MIKFNKKCVWSFPRGKLSAFEQGKIITLDDKTEEDMIKAGYADKVSAEQAQTHTEPSTKKHKKRHNAAREDKLFSPEDKADK